MPWARRPKASSRFSSRSIPSATPKYWRTTSAAFHHSLVGLTGSPEEIRKVANSYKAFYAKVPDERSGDYSIDHTGVIYLMGRDGEYLGFMPPQTNPERLTEILRKYLAK